jgi:hypothetical protein
MDARTLNQLPGKIKKWRQPYPAADENLFSGSPVRDEPLAEGTEKIEVVTMMKICEETGTLTHHLVKYIQASPGAGLSIFRFKQTHIEYAEWAAQERVYGITDLDHQELTGNGKRRITGRGQSHPEIAGGKLHIG